MSQAKKLRYLQLEGNKLTLETFPVFIAETAWNSLSVSELCSQLF